MLNLASVGNNHAAPVLNLLNGAPTLHHDYSSALKSTTSKLPTQATQSAQPSGDFAALLAQQISESGTTALNSPIASATIDCAENAVHSQGESSNSVAAMLLQLPTAAQNPASLPPKNASGTLLATDNLTDGSNKPAEVTAQNTSLVSDYSIDLSVNTLQPASTQLLDKHANSEPREKTNHRFSESNGFSSGSVAMQRKDSSSDNVAPDATAQALPIIVPNMVNSPAADPASANSPQENTRAADTIIVPKNSESLGMTQRTASPQKMERQAPPFTDEKNKLDVEEHQTATLQIRAENISTSLNVIDAAKAMTAGMADTLQPPSNNTQLAAPLQTAMPTSTLDKNTLSNSNSTITAQVGSDVWTEEFSQKITWVSTQQNQMAELRLSPPDLGPLNVMLKISDNQLTAQFISPHSAVREAVENSLPRLREILSDNNIMLGNATVSDNPSRDQSAGKFSQQDFDQKTPRTPLSNVDEPSPALLTTRIIDPRRHNGLLDTFA